MASLEDRKEPTSTTLKAINVGTGDCYLLTITRKGKEVFILYDTGIGMYWESGAKVPKERRLLPYMNKIFPKGEGRETRSGAPIKVDAVVLSHPDNDHYGGLRSLLFNGRIETRYVFLSVTQFSQHVPDFMDKLTKKHGFEIHSTKKWLTKSGFPRDTDCNPELKDPSPIGEFHVSEDKIMLLGDEVTLIYPQISSTAKNDGSILLLVHNPKILLTGDTNGPMIQRYINCKDSFGFFNVPHHGSKENSVVPVSHPEIKHLREEFSATKKTTDSKRESQQEDESGKLVQAKDDKKISDSKQKSQQAFENVKRKQEVACEESTGDRKQESKPDTDVEEKIQKTLKIVAFYRLFISHTYFISCGDTQKYPHPHEELLCGIILAAVSQKRECIIVLNSPADYKEKLGLLETIMPGCSSVVGHSVKICTPENSNWKYWDSLSNTFEYE